MLFAKKNVYFNKYNLHSQFRFHSLQNMEIKSQLTVGSLEFKISNEKLFIDTISGSETYALRSINGISVKDDINGYNLILNQLKQRKNLAYFLIVFGVLFLVMCLSGGLPIMGIILGSLFAVPGIISLSKITEPRMESIVRITMNSGDKAFGFFKDDANSAEVADFVATLESTLTAFHKD